MSYSIDIADIYDTAINTELRKLIQAAFKDPALLPEHYLPNNMESGASEKSFFLVAKESGRIIGCNGYIANDFLFNGRNVVGYQSCWTATHPDHQGKNVFTNIMNEAKEMLRPAGAGFIYGIPNNVSRPLCVNKLGFAEIPSQMLRVFNIPFYKSCYFSNAIIDKEEVCAINEEQLIASKTTQHPAELKIINYNGSRIWGKLMKKKKFGLRIPVFYAGGITLEKEADLPVLMEVVFKTHKVRVIQLLSCQTNSLNALFKGWQKPRHMNDFIFFNLNMPPIKHFNVMAGALDVF